MTITYGQFWAILGAVAVFAFAAGMPTGVVFHDRLVTGAPDRVERDLRNLTNRARRSAGQ